MSRTLQKESPAVIVEENGNAGVIILDRQKLLNTLNLEMVNEIYAALRDFEPRKDLVIIKGAGEKVFCAGGDVRDLAEGTAAAAREFFKNSYRNNELIAKYSIPLVALIDGVTMGAGVGLAIHGKYRVATERTILAMPETAIGFIPDVGSSFILPRMPGNLGIFLGLTGHKLKGHEVLKTGFATNYVESSTIHALEYELTRCQKSSDVENIIHKFSSISKCTRPSVLEVHSEQIEKAFAGKSVEEIFLNLEADGSAWAIENLQNLRKMSPTSLKVTFRQLQLGKTMTLSECIQMELGIIVHCCMHSDVKEGVRALLIDKDRQPKWNPATVEEVTEEHVNWFFSPLPANL